MKTIDMITSNGALKGKVRDEVRQQVINATTVNGQPLQRNELGEYYLQIAQAVQGEPIYAKVQVSISLLDMPNRKRKTKNDETVKDEPVVDLFG